MKPNELRIGNYLNWQVGASIMQGVVTNISTSTIVIDHKSNFKTKSESDTYRLIPIPLSEEWLLKFGFRKMDDCLVGYEYNLNSGHKITFLNKELYCYLDDLALDEIKFIHQLQNLYFILTNNEFEIHLQ